MIFPWNGTTREEWKVGRCHRPLSRRFRILLRQPLSSNVPLACSWPPTFSFSVSPLPITIPLNKQVTATTLRSRLIGRNQLIRPPALKAIHSLLKVSRIVPSNNLRLWTLEELATSILDRKRRTFYLDFCKCMIDPVSCTAFENSIKE